MVLQDEKARWEALLCILGEPVQIMHIQVAKGYTGMQLLALQVEPLVSSPWVFGMIERLKLQQTHKLRHFDFQREKTRLAAHFGLLKRFTTAQHDGI